MRAPALFVALIRGALALRLVRFGGLLGWDDALMQSVALSESFGFGSAGVLHRWNRPPAVVYDCSARQTTHR